MSKSKFAFPRYNTSTFTSTNTASASLNKWLRSEGFGQYTMHSFRHSLRDRLRYVGCPSEITDQIGGWSNKTVGQSYGIGYRLCNLNIWMQRLVWKHSLRAILRVIQSLFSQLTNLQNRTRRRLRKS